jgi:hypothetical protein
MVWYELIKNNFSIPLVSIVARVRRRSENIHPQNYLKCGKSRKYEETRNSCLLLVEKWNGSRHLVF